MLLRTPMAGCTNCGAKTGCDHRKQSMFGAIDDALERLYPGRRWGEPDDAARFGAGIGEDEGHELAEELAIALSAATLFRRGRDDEYCDYIYVLCLGREPALVQIRDAGVPVPAELGDGGAVDELYLRVCLSNMARLAGVQQAAFSGRLEGDELAIVERPRPGVYDAPLLPRFQRLVALLGERDILHVDFGEISAPPADFDHGSYAALYGAEPHISNYIFYPQPSTTVVSELIRR